MIYDNKKFSVSTFNELKALFNDMPMLFLDFVKSSVPVLILGALKILFKIITHIFVLKGWAIYSFSYTTDN